MLPSFFSIFARIPSYVCPSIAQSLVSSSPIWCDRSLQQTVMDGLPCGRLPYWGRLTIILEQCHVLFSRMWRPNPDATEEDIKTHRHLIVQCYTSRCQLVIKLWDETRGFIILEISSEPVLSQRQSSPYGPPFLQGSKKTTRALGAKG